MFVSIRSLAIFQSTLPVKGATQLFYADGWGNFISIHAPREGSDRDTAKKPIIIGVFQSTLPVKGATRTEHIQTQTADISIHAPREGSDTVQAMGAFGLSAISIHAPREGSDSNVD